jgi:DNA-binding transcriptional LysR family regulator
VELAQLEMFVAVVEERNIRKAAERLFRTQPAVSIALKKLEDQTKAVLLDRRRGRAKGLTPAGELLYEFASRMIAVRDEAVSKLRGEKCACNGRLSIGVAGPSASERASLLAAQFRARHPAVRTEISSDQEVNLLSELSMHKLDAAFLTAVPGHQQLPTNLRIACVCAFRDGHNLCLATPRAGRSHTLLAFEEMVRTELEMTIRGTPESNRWGLVPHPKRQSYRDETNQNKTRARVCRRAPASCRANSRSATVDRTNG